MLAVFLSILKVACIVLAIVLLIAILLVLLVLFVPIRYRIKGNYPETVFEEGEGVDKDKFFLSVKFSWLLHILSGKFLYPKRPEFVIRVFGIKIFPRKEKKIKEKYNDEKSDEKFGDSELPVTEKDNPDETNISPVDPIEKESTELKEEVDEITEEKLNIDDDETFFDKLKKVAETALELIKMPKRR